MRRKLFFFCALFLAIACQKNEETQQHDMTQPRQSDRKANGGLLRFTLGDKPMHDSFFEAQFTPRGQMFDTDNLQLYNYNFDSDKYPQLFITVDHVESDLSRWIDHSMPTVTLAFTAAANAPTIKAPGTVKLSKVNERTIEGSFSGELVTPGAKVLEIRGEFRAVLRINI